MPNFYSTDDLDDAERAMFLKECYCMGFISGGKAVLIDCLAFIIGKYGEFNQDEFTCFVQDPIMRPQYQHFYNKVSHMRAGFIGRIN